MVKSRCSRWPVVMRHRFACWQQSSVSARAIARMAVLPLTVQALSYLSLYLAKVLYKDTTLFHCQLERSKNSDGRHLRLCRRQ